MIRPLFAAVILILSVTAFSAMAQEAKATELKVGSFTFKVAPSWMVKAEKKRFSEGGFTLPGKAGAAPVESDFYFFGAGGGGGIEPNIQRWRAQFTPDADGNVPTMEREELSFGEHKALLVTLKGTFLSGPAMSAIKTPMPGYAMLGAILQSPEGDVFIKITGPAAPTLATKEEVKAMVKAAFAK